MTEHVTIPCEICGTPTPNRSVQRCENCWEVERRLPDYLKSPNGMAFARKAVPLLDDWADQKPDAWDYEAVLRDNDVTVEWCDQMTSDDGKTFEPMPPDLCGWGVYWKHGCIHIGQCTEIIARKAAALFVSLWLRGVSASFADKLMAGFVWYLELQEGMRLTFLAEIKHAVLADVLRLTREGFCTQGSLDAYAEEIIAALGSPGPDEEIIVTFSKRKKAPHHA